ncbi:MAG: adenylate/guanylate cyclase domain-containing protein [Rhizobiaceae bacterium]
MDQSDDMPADLIAEREKEMRNLRKETVLLRKKLNRSEVNRQQSESMKDQTDALYKNLLDELTRQKAQMESLSVQLGKYLSPQVYASIFYGQRNVELRTERKKLTVFFSDIKDFTAITSDLQPEDLTYLLNSYFSEMSKIAIQYGATIDKFIGDAMLIFTGDPETNGVAEDARSAVRMAVDMQRRMTDLAEVWKAEGFNMPFKMRVGINTGYCNVGNFGSEERMDYTIIGEEVNLAARLESATDPGGILLSYETYALVKDIVKAEECDAIMMKGVKREVRTFAIRDIWNEHDLDSRVIHHEADGLYLHLDFEKLRGHALAETKARFSALLARLDNEEDQ